MPSIVLSASAMQLQDGFQLIQLSRWLLLAVVLVDVSAEFFTRRDKPNNSSNLIGYWQKAIGRT